MSMLKNLINAHTLMAKIFFILLFTNACSGHLYSRALDSKALTSQKKIDGIISYPSKTLIEVYKKTSFINKKGELVANESGSAGKKCVPQLERKVVVRPDYNKPIQIFYEPGILENNEFGVTLKDGVLTGVNTKSQPDRGQTLTNLGSAATSFGGIAGLGAPLVAGSLACNATPLLEGIYEAPKVESWSKVPPGK